MWPTSFFALSYWPARYFPRPTPLIVGNWTSVLTTVDIDPDVSWVNDIGYSEPTD